MTRPRHSSTNRQARRSRRSPPASSPPGRAGPRTHRRSAEEDRRASAVRAGTASSRTITGADSPILPAARSDAVAAIIRRLQDRQYRAARGRGLCAHRRPRRKARRGDQGAHAPTRRQPPNHPSSRRCSPTLKAGRRRPRWSRPPQAGAAEVLYGLGSAIGTDEGTELPAAYLQTRRTISIPTAILPLTGAWRHPADGASAARMRSPSTVAFPDRSPLRPQSPTSSRRSASTQLDRIDEAANHIKRVVDANPAESRGGDGARQHLSRPRAFRRGCRRLFARHRTIADQSKADWRIFYFRGVSPRAEQALAGGRGGLQAGAGASTRTSRRCSTISAIPGSIWASTSTRRSSMIKTAVDLRPNDGYIVDSLGWAYYRLGRYDDAVSAARARRRTEAGRFGHQRPSRRRLLAGRAQARGDVPVAACPRPRSRSGRAGQDRQEARERDACQCPQRRVIRFRR